MSRNKKDRNNLMNMMGYGGDSDDDNADFEAELAAVMGGGAGPSKKTKKPAPKLLDWSIIDAQVEASMKDDDDEMDDDVNVADENEFMSELNDLIEEDPTLLHPGTTQGRNRSPSPQPSQPGGVLEELKARKAMYELAVKNAQSKGESSKVRRLQRGSKTLDGLIRSAKAGKPINDDDIPPVVATGQPPTSDPSPIQQEAPLIDISPPQTPTQPPITPPRDFRPAPPLPTHAPITPKVTPPPKVAPPPGNTTESKMDADSINFLETRKHEYKTTALKAKHEGDKETAIKYLRLLKLCDAEIEAAKAGKQVNHGSFPAANTTSSAMKTQDIPSRAPAVQVTSVPEPAVMQAAQATPHAPTTALDALEQRMQKYQSSSEAAKKEGNGSKARRMGRIVKQYQDAIKSVKAGRKVNFNELPVPPGFPPIPGNTSQPEVNILEQANALIQQDDDNDDQPQALKPPPVATRKTSPQRSGDASTTKKTPSPQPSGSSQPLQTKYEQQVAFLENRQAAFKKAALEAKHKGDRTTAIELIKKMKGFDSLIEAAKGGMKIDISKVPQPPVEDSLGDDDGFEMIDSHVGGASTTPEEDQAVYTRILESLTSQVKKARAYAQQMTHAGDVAAAERCDRLATNSQADHDYVRSCIRHKDQPPRFHYEQQVFETTRLNPDIGTNELELLIVQCIDLHAGGKDKMFVEWEMPFPHDNPIKGHTEEARPSQSPKFEATFRVPFVRKLKSSQRAIRSKAIKLDVIAKGGFLRSDKSLGATQIKLAALDTHCELHAIEELKENRNVSGKIEVYVRLRTPLSESDSTKSTERWLFVEHTKRHLSPSHASSSKKSVSPNRASPRPSARADDKKVNIASVDVLELELKVIRAKLENYKKKGTSPPSGLINEGKMVQMKLETTRRFLKQGGSHAKKEYISCLKQQYQHLSIEIQAYTKNGKKEQAKLALTKKNYVKAELDKLVSA